MTRKSMATCVLLFVLAPHLHGQNVATATLLPEGVFRPPQSWAGRAHRNLIYFNEVDKGGHFAAWEPPELFAAERRAAFRSLC